MRKNRRVMTDGNVQEVIFGYVDKYTDWLGLHAYTATYENGKLIQWRSVESEGRRIAA